MLTNGEKVVVALVPGIFASYLNDRTGKGPGWHVNPKESLLTHARLTSLSQRRGFSNPASLFPEGPASKAPSGVDANLGWQNVFLEVYKPFLDAINDGSATPNFNPVVYATGYNFAVSNELTASRDLAFALTRIFARHKDDPGFKSRFFLVTHSMGALVARRLLQIYDNLLGQCLGVIHVAAPNGGAPEALVRFIRGMRSDTLLGRRTVDNIFGNAGWKVSTAASNIAAGFELLPYGLHFETQPSKVFAAIGAPVQTPQEARNDPFFLRNIASTGFSDVPATVQFKVNGAARTQGAASESFPKRSPIWKGARSEKDAIVGDIQKNLAQARKFHDHLAPAPLFRHTAAVALTGVSTVQSVKLTFGLGGRLVESDERRTDDGDGTVPLVSQTFRLPRRATATDGREFNALETVRGIEHDKALADAGVVRHVITFLNRFYSPLP